FADFHTITRRHTGDPTQDGLEVFRRAVALLRRERLPQPVRLIGVAASGFRPAGTGQLDLLDAGAVRRERLAHAMDRITGRFGAGAIRPAALVPPPLESSEGASPPFSKPPPGRRVARARPAPE
ncbi:MAG TPA: hypothetical protein VFX28_09095, partial [Methylomirabilota bacterium]|nr:hypothetical protein [Methylomirabilota bacterium]